MDILFLGGVSFMFQSQMKGVWSGVGGVQGEKGSVLWIKRSGKQRAERVLWEGGPGSVKTRGYLGQWGQAEGSGGGGGVM